MDIKSFVIKTPKPTLSNNIAENQRLILDYTSEALKEIELAINNLEDTKQEVQQ